MTKRLLICVTMLLAFVVQRAWGQTGKFFDIDHLRSGLFINQLYIDRNGFLWAVTSNGIVQCTYPALVMSSVVETSQFAGRCPA